ncbi:MAG TPA: hypothetical protein VGR73_21560 [Bryobacteraceae bacterium]|nr:hypothetical protein [Bryobacteraceae bacterium]
MIPADFRTTDVADKLFAKNRAKMLQVGQLNLVAALRERRLLGAKPIIRSCIERLWAHTVLQSVIAFLQLSPPRILGRAGNLLGATLGRLADLLTSEVEFVPPCFLAGVLEQLRSRTGWVAWRYEWRDGAEGRDGKWTKVPYQVNGRRASSTDPQTWATFEEVLGA